MNNEEFSIPDILFDAIIPRDMTLDQKKEIFWQTNNPPLWMHINDYVVIFLCTRKIKQSKKNWQKIASSNNDMTLLLVASATVDQIRHKYYNAICPNYNRLEISHFTAHMVDSGTIQIIPENPEILLSVSQNFYKNKKIKFNPAELEKFFTKQLSTIEFNISLHEHGCLVDLQGTYIIIHCYYDVPDVIIRFPKWH